MHGFESYKLACTFAEFEYVPKKDHFAPAAIKLQNIAVMDNIQSRGNAFQKALRRYGNESSISERVNTFTAAVPGIGSKQGFSFETTDDEATMSSSQDH